MANYRVVCVERKPATGHQHVTGVGVIRGKRALERMSVVDVRKAIKAKKDTFYSVDSTTGDKVVVKRHKCCGEKTICAVIGDTKADTLAALSSCNRLTWYMVR
ncbi:MAG TPA: hypothetical protein VNC61_10360 [Acidimicrobiales bacterium]|nr:hypothetical protein [Acidimicrobiales bacterium]